MTGEFKYEPEEEWEVTISSMLSRMPPVDPPAGFMDKALNHRPLYAGRTSLGLGALALFGMAAAVGFGGLRQSGVVPQIDSLAEQHSLVAASFFGPFQSAGASETPTEDPAEIMAELPEVELPSGLEPKASFEGSDFRQALFGATSVDAVSVFSQPGLVDFSKLPADGLITMEDVPAWIDAAKSITVIQAKDEAVTIVGLPANEVAAVVRSVPKPNVGDKMTEAINTITSHLGFPDLY